MTANDTFDKELYTFFKHCLSRIYFGKANLMSRLTNLQTVSEHQSLISTLRDLGGNIRRQMARIELVYELLDEPMKNTIAGGVDGLLNDIFYDVDQHKHKGKGVDLSIIFCLQNIESLEVAGFKMLRMAAVPLRNAQVKQLLKENYYDAKANRHLLLLIAAELMVTKP